MVFRVNGKNDIFWFERGPGFGVLGGTPPPRISRSTPSPPPSGGILNGRIVLSEVIAYRGLSVLKVRIWVEECEDLNLQIEATFSRYDRLLALSIQFITHFVFINAPMKEIGYWLMYSFCDSYNDRHFVCFCQECSNIFSTGGAGKLADEFGVNFLGSIPLDQVANTDLYNTSRVAYTTGYIKA